MQLAIFVYYWFEWRTLQNFVVAIDRYSNFMQDFTSHYYAMGRQILQVPTPVSGYYYTSFFALVLAPIGTLPLPSAMVLWGAIQLACLVTLCIVSGRGLLALPPLGMVLYAGLCVTSFPILHNIRWGQVSVLITLCVIAAFLAANRNKRVLAAVLLAFAAAIKFYPALFIVYFVLKRDVRTCVAFGLAALTFYFVLPASVLGFSNWLEFERATSTAFSSIEWMPRDVNSQYIVHVGLRWFEIIFNRAASDALVLALTIIGYIIALSCMAMVWLLQRRSSCEKHGLSVVAIFLSIPFVIKTSWPHYFVYLPFCQAAVLSYYASAFRNSNLQGKVLSALPLLSVFLSSVFLFNLFPNWQTYSSYGMLFVANLLLLIAVYAVEFGRSKPFRF
jgi:alpha-1,2-mannosyltransferase